MSKNPLLVNSIQEPLTPEEFQLFTDLFRSLSGIQIKPEKQGLVESRLRKRFLTLRVLPSEYLEILKENKEELAQFVTALTTHKTDWFREPIHFRVMENIVTEFKKQNPHSPFLCWSAACATGEEVYSAAMTLDKLNLTPNDWRILGSDISTHCIEHAKMGIYSRATVDNQVPPEIIKRYFLRNLKDEHKDFYRFTPDFNRQIKFREFNLTESKLPIDIEFNLIFLRNVLIYFDKEMTHKIIQNLLAYLKPGGALILGLSETIPFPDQYNLRRLESSVYIK